MKKPFEKLFKVFAFLWFGFSAILIVMLISNLLSTLSYSSEDNLVLAIMVFSVTVAFRFTYKTWKFKITKENSELLEPTELLLDDLEETTSNREQISFKDYKLSSVLAILAGAVSTLFGLWGLSSLEYMRPFEIQDLLEFGLIVTLIMFGLLMSYKAILVLKNLSK